MLAGAAFPAVAGVSQSARLGRWKLNISAPEGLPSFTGPTSQRPWTSPA